jgi:uncharacterized protein YoxC
MQEDMLWLVVALCAVVIAVSVAAIAWAIVRLAREADRTADEANGLIRILREELPATLATLQRTSGSLDQLAGESAARLLLLDRLAVEAEATMVAVRDLSGSVNDIVRGPADTVTGVKRSARMVGGGIASGADKLRRAITGEHEDA